MTNENRSSAANGETETTRKATANENAENKNSNRNRAANDKAEMDITETKKATTNGKPATHSPWPARGGRDLLGSSPPTNKKTETHITENKNVSTNKNTEKEVTKNSRPAEGQPGSRINSPQELARVWKAFLDAKFSQTDLERARAEFESLPAAEGEDGNLTREEFNQAVRQMKKGKATGKDNIPAEVWQSSTVAQDALFEFIQRVWSKEHVPANLTVCIFVMIFKRKGALTQRLLQIQASVGGFWGKTPHLGHMWTQRTIFEIYVLKCEI